MNHNKPIILLSFANQLDGYLQHLKQESSVINNTLSKLHDEGCIEVYREESTNAETLFNALMRFRERIAILHYAGHADGNRLYFEDNSGDVQGIAGLLSELPHLKLVFLNGCATKNQVQFLFKKGVKAVIATAVPIDDAKATQFAQKFYQSLASHCNIRIAFDSAIAFMQMHYGESFKGFISTADELNYVTDAANNLPWGLYFLDEAAKKEITQWSLPLKPISNTFVQNNQNHSDYHPNMYIVSCIEAMIRYEPKIEALVVDEYGDLKDEREILLQIIEQLPWPIGVQIRLLATKDNNMDKPSIERLHQIVSTYVVSMQFIYYTLLSQIWEQKRLLQQPQVFSNHLQIGYITRSDFNFFDYSYYILQAAQELKSLDIPFFLSDFEDFLKEFENVNSDLQSSNTFLHTLRLRINDNDPTLESTNLAHLCADAEYALAIILDAIAFLVKYELITIRDIKVCNYRYEETVFEHFIGRLNAKVTEISTTSRQVSRPRAFSSFVHNASVVLTSRIDDINSYLTLSPFIIDKNAYGMGITEDKATEQLLFMYAYREQSEFKYLSTMHNIYRAQERMTDQFVTNEGQEERSTAATERSGRGRFMNRGRRSLDETQDNTPSPYAILRNQFNTFEKDFSF